MTGVHRAVILLGLLLAAFGALLGALGSPPVAAASIIVGGALAVAGGLWLRHRTRAGKPRPLHYVGSGDAPAEFGNDPYETLLLPRPDVDRAVATGLYARGTAPAIPPEEVVRRERLAIREAELAREAELNAIAEGLRSLRGRQALATTRIPEWRARIERWVDAELKAKADRGEPMTEQAAEWMRDFGEIPNKDWRGHLLRHLRRLGYRHYQEGEW